MGGSFRVSRSVTHAPRARSGGRGRLTLDGGLGVGRIAARARLLGLFDFATGSLRADHRRPHLVEQLAHERLGEAGHRGERLPPRGARPPRPARSAAAPSRVAPRILPSLEEGLPPVDGIAAVCRAALGGGYGRVGYAPSGKGLVEDGGAGGLKPSATLRASVADPAAFASVYAQSPRSSAHRRGTPRRPTSPSAASRQSGWRMATESGTRRPPTTHRSCMSSANTRTPSNHR